jgi:hypothetical protein
VEAIFAATGCGSGVGGVVATAARRLVASIPDGCGSAEIGFAGLADAMGTSARRGLCRTRGCGESSGSGSATDADDDGWTSTTGTSLSLAVSSAVAVSSRGDDSGVRVSGFRWGLVPGALASADCFGGSAFAASGALAELSELESAFEGDGSSAWAIPLPNPTATQVASKNAATVNRIHQ